MKIKKALFLLLLMTANIVSGSEMYGSIHMYNRNGVYVFQGLYCSMQAYNINNVNHMDLWCSSNQAIPNLGNTLYYEDDFVISVNGYENVCRLEEFEINTHNYFDVVFDCTKRTIFKNGFE